MGTASNGRRNGSPGGFTLMELLIVLATMAVLMTLSTPLFMQWHGDTSASRGARAAYDLLRQARNRAMRTNYQHLVRFEPNQGRFEMARGSQAYRTPATGWSTVANSRVNVRHGVEMRSGPDGTSTAAVEVKFNADGTAGLESPQGTPLPPEFDCAVISLQGGAPGRMNRVLVSRCGRISLQ